MKIEDRGTGRVRLSDFYRPASQGDAGAWQFQESIGYLRELGALDESNPDDPRVMISNYLTSQTNCIASSDYYSVCCLNECEGLLAHLEKEIAAPEAKSAHIAELISALPSSTVAGPRVLSATLRSRLEDIAVEHGGLVQLHSRLFSQWMHHAYPRECPFPHVSGTTNQITARRWEKDSGVKSVATDEEVLQFTEISNTTRSTLEESADPHDLMMWTHEEELLVVRPASVSASGRGSSLATGLRNVILFAAMMSMIFGLVRTTATMSDTKEASQKFMV
jgi:diadenosine tetraphosphatase ApaH/serine/threonine PP2A family protein phosphatase